MKVKVIFFELVDERDQGLSSAENKGNRNRHKERDMVEKAI